MSASGGPAADNNELRAQLTEAVSDVPLIKAGEQQTFSMSNVDGLHLGYLASLRVAQALLPLIVAFGDARYQEGDEAGYARGRNDAAEAIRDDTALQTMVGRCQSLAERLARGEG